MSRCYSPSILNYYVSFMYEKDLWIVMPFIEGGSMRQIINQKFKDGIQDEVLLATIIKMILDGLIYMHD